MMQPGDGTAAILVYNKGGRDFRFDRLRNGEEQPREFFYGFLDMLEAGLPAEMRSSSGALPGPVGASVDLVERALVRVLGIGTRPLSARLRAFEARGARVLMSFTDGFSLSLGLGYPSRPGHPIVMGGFHGLSDMGDRAPAALRGLVHATVRRALAGLDHAFFFGGPDRDRAMELYGLPAERSSVIPFGVDTGFWRPLPEEETDDFVLAVGQDPNRDYDLLARAPGRHPTRIITRRPVSVPPGATHVKTSAGDFFGSDSVSDADLRRLYNRATAVIVPLKDVWQPSGCSVTLQSLACGRPVILTRTRGLWDSVNLVHDENCLFVPPGDAAALGAAIGRLRADPGLVRRLGDAARETALAHFGLDQMGRHVVALGRLGLDLAERRSRDGHGR